MGGELILVTQNRRNDLKNRFTFVAIVPEFFCSLDPMIHFLDLGFDQATGDRQSSPPVLRVVHARRIVAQISNCLVEYLAGIRLVRLVRW